MLFDAIFFLIFLHMETMQCKQPEVFRVNNSESPWQLTLVRCFKTTPLPCRDEKPDFPLFSGFIRFLGSGPVGDNDLLVVPTFLNPVNKTSHIRDLFSRFVLLKK